MAGATRQKILDAAEKLLLLKGLARVTTKEIARETGLSEGALYRHFDHKEEIFFVLKARHLPAFHETFQAPQEGTGTPSENLAAIAQAALHYYDQIVPMGASFLADTELLAHFRATIRPLGIGPQNVFELVAAYIEEAQQLGRIGRQVSALTIAILFLGPFFQWPFNGSSLGPDPFLNTAPQFVAAPVQVLSR